MTLYGRGVIGGLSMLLMVSMWVDLCRYVD